MRGAHRRLAEVDFAKRSLELTQLVHTGKLPAARSLLADLTQRFQQHPWLQAKLARLRELAERDPEMMSKEARFSSRRMSSRLAAHADLAFCADETNSVMPAFLRTKTEEGRGRRN